MNRSSGAARVTFAVLSVSLAALLPAQDNIPVRALPEPTAVSTDSLGIRVSVRALSNGKLLVNDIQRFRVLLYEASLKTYTVVLDSVTAVGGTGGQVPSVHLIPVPGDSTLYVDFGSRSLLVMDPAGKVAHVMSLPRPSDAVYLAVGTIYGTPVLDAKGRLVYQGIIPPSRTNGQILSGLQNQTMVEAPSPPDSSPIVRADFDARKLDTLTTVKLARRATRITISKDAKWNLTQRTTINPLDWGDEWAMLPNGTIAILRAHDYHIDWMDADGTKRSTPKMAFDWKRLTDDDKQKMIDTIKPLLDKQAAAQAPVPINTPDGMRRLTNEYELVKASELPDYQPPIFPGSLKVDLEGNLWIVPRTAIPTGNGGLRYDVVNASGTIFERITLPKGRAIAGFGPGGVIILSNTQGTVTTIERTRLK